MKKLFITLTLLALTLPVYATSTPPHFFNDGMALYNAGRYSEAMDAFDNAIKRRDRADEAQHYLDRIRKETVERIRNRALTGVSKTTWQSKFFYIRTIDNRMRVGISSQEMFERQSLNFREGAVDALMQLASILQRNDSANVDIDLISEVSEDTVINPDLVARQQAEVFSYLSLASQDLLPRYQSSTSKP